MGKKWHTQEEKQELYRRIKEEIKIGDYAYEIGLTPVTRTGNRYMTLREHDSVRIDMEKNCFWRNSVPGKGKSIGKGGSVIDFALEFTENSLAEILSDFESRLENREYGLNQSKSETHLQGIEKKTSKKKVEGLVLPPAASHMRNVFAYLTKSRFIEKNVVQEFVDKKMLYQDQKNNCVFVAYDYTHPDKQNEPVFVAIRGTNTEHRFLGDAEGSDYEKGFYINNLSDSVIITESVIEAMSVMSVLQQRGMDYHEYNYLALSGTGKGEPIKTITEQCPKFERYIFAMNNDKAGILATKKYAEFLRNELKVESELKSWRPKTAGFDWNDELKKNFFDRFGVKFRSEPSAIRESPAKKMEKYQDYEMQQEDRELER